MNNQTLTSFVRLLERQLEALVTVLAILVFCIRAPIFTAPKFCWRTYDRDAATICPPSYIIPPGEVLRGIDIGSSILWFSNLIHILSQWGSRTI